MNNDDKAHRSAYAKAITKQFKEGVYLILLPFFFFLVVPHRKVVLLFYVHGKHLRSCRDGQLT